MSETLPSYDDMSEKELKRTLQVMRSDLGEVKAALQEEGVDVSSEKLAEEVEERATRLTELVKSLLGTEESPLSEARRQDHEALLDELQRFNEEGGRAAAHADVLLSGRDGVDRDDEPDATGGEVWL